MILAVAKLTDRLSSFTFEVDRGGVEEDNIKTAEEIRRTWNMSSSIRSLMTSRCKRRLSFLIFQLFPEKGHGPIEMMQGQIVNAIDDVVPVPLVADTGRNRKQRAGAERSEK